MKKLRLGIIGAGIAARDLHGPAIKALADRFQVAAICSRTLDKAQDLAMWYGVDAYCCTDWADLLSRPDVDAVVAALPIALNVSVVQACVEAGKPLIVEKPIGCTVEEGEQVVTLAESRSTTVFIAENFRFSPELLQAKGLLEAGEIGRIAALRYNAIGLMAPDNKYMQTGWRQCPVHLGGFLSDGGVHNVAAMRLLGGPIVKAQATGVTIQPYLSSTDTVLINLQFTSGLIGQISLGYGAFDPDGRKVKVYGENGTLVITRDRIEVWSLDGRQRSEPVTGPSNFVSEFTAFYDMVNRGEKSPDSAHQALADLRVIDAAIRSVESGGAQVELNPPA
jgi:predicted dehydrogenase